MSKSLRTVQPVCKVLAERKPGAVVIDVAMNRDPETGKFFGDVVFDEVAKKAAFITPVPGGVGPMTRAMLMKNILTAAQQHKETHK